MSTSSSINARFDLSWQLSGGSNPRRYAETTTARGSMYNVGWMVQQEVPQGQLHTVYLQLLAVVLAVRLLVAMCSLRCAIVPLLPHQLRCYDAPALANEPCEPIRSSIW